MNVAAVTRTINQCTDKWLNDKLNWLSVSPPFKTCPCRTERHLQRRGIKLGCTACWCSTLAALTHTPSPDAHAEQQQLNVLEALQLSKGRGLKKKEKPRTIPFPLPFAVTIFAGALGCFSSLRWRGSPEEWIHCNACQFPLSAGASL